MNAAAAVVVNGPALAQRLPWSDRVSHLGLLGIVLLLGLGLVAPLVAILSQSLNPSASGAAGLAAFTSYLASPALLGSLWNSVWVSLLVTLIVVPLAFTFAYAITRSCMPVSYTHLTLPTSDLV